MLKFFSENNTNKFLRKNISNISTIKEYKYLYKIQKGRVQYILNLSTLELAILSGTTLDQIVKDPEHKYIKTLLRHNFLIDENEDSLEISKNISNLVQAKPKYSLDDKSVTSYLIFTTTDCNARCFYCYEKGCNKESMSLNTAQALVDYMKRHYAEGSELHLKWFGGEPLYNSEVIDYITNELIKADIKYTSRMISNGYLLNQEIIDKAINKWNLKATQITLDGTRDIYNKTKDYIYPDVNAFETVINNIKLAVNSGLKIRLRFNVSLANIDDLLQLAEDLKNYWDEETRSKLSGYAHLLFQLEQNKKDYTDEFIAKYDRLEDTLSNLFTGRSKSRKTKLKLKHGCMTTNQHQVGVLPNGYLCSCEHFEEEAPWGSIFNDDTKPVEIAHKWTEIAHFNDEDCNNCNYYPLCYALANCPASRQLCNPINIKNKELAIQSTINQLISKYKKQYKESKRC